MGLVKEKLMPTTLPSDKYFMYSLVNPDHTEFVFVIAKCQSRACDLANSKSKHTKFDINMIVKSTESACRCESVFEYICLK